MNGSHRIGHRLSQRRVFRRSLAVAMLVLSSVAMSSGVPASAASLPYRIDLRVLLLDDNSPWVDAIELQMIAEGVPYTAVTLGSGSRPLITDAYLSSGDRAFYQAVVGPDAVLAALSDAERTALRAFEAKFGVRQVDAYNWANPAVGLHYAALSGDIEGTVAAVTPAGRAGGFGYLNGPVPFSAGSWSYVAEPLDSATLPPGASYTTLVGAPLPSGATGSLVGVYSNAGVEQMIITAAFNFQMPQFKYLAHGIVTWMTRGVHFGYNRNNLTFHVDDAFNAVALWDSTLNCTPGEDCPGEPSVAVLTQDDVRYAVNWMQANDYQLTLAFNAFYADAMDPLTQALQVNASKFRWLNHGFEHLYQGCKQTDTLPFVCTFDTNGQIIWVTQQVILDEISRNVDAGHALGLPFDATEYLSGEHSGLRHTEALEPSDNPNFVTALNLAGIAYVGADASREATSRQVGTATTIPRHPTALYYNTATQAQAVDEYNWLYTSRDIGGSGYCDDNPATATCLAAPLGADGFMSYIVPTDAAFDMSFVLGNDPRPFYAHTSNMTGDRLLYNLVDTILGLYRAAFTPATPLVNLTLTEASTELDRQTQWAATGAADVTGYVENGQITITNPAGVAVPFTAPTGTVINATTLRPYGGEVSGWSPTGSTTGTLPPTVVNTTGNTVFIVGQNGALGLSGGSGAPAATVSFTGTLPTGLTSVPTAGSVAITGIPAAGTEGSYPLDVTVISGAGHQVQHVVIIVARLPQLTSAASATAVSGVPFSFRVQAAGAPLPSITVSGVLPTGISFAANPDGTAMLAGTTSNAMAGRSFPVTLTATNVGGVTTQTFTLTVTRAPQFTTGTSATAVSGVPFSFTVQAAGAPLPSITVSGALPTGIAFTYLGSGTATLSGIAPKAAADHSFPVTFTATNSAGQATQGFNLTVEADYMSLVSLTPARLADTRPGQATVDGLFAGQGARPRGSTLELVVVDRGGVSVDAAAVALNVTVTEPTGSGFVTVYPCGSAQPLASNVNFTRDAVVPNAVIAKVGDDGKVCVFVSNETHLVVDVNGYFPSTSSFHSMNPARVLETRPGLTTIDGSQQGDGIRSPGTMTKVKVTERVTVPAEATAVVLNVTVTEAEGPGFVTVYPCGTGIPTASNINYIAGSTVANLVVAKIGADGSICIFNSEGIHLVVDVNGYFPRTTSYTPFDPARLLDTRPELTTIDGRFVGAGIVPAGAITELAVTGRGGVPAGAATVVLNVTVTESTAAGFVTAYPCGIGRPLASNLNYGIGTTIAIAAIVEVAREGTVCLFNSGATHLIVDVNGYLPG